MSKFIISAVLILIPNHKRAAGVRIHVCFVDILYIYIYIYGIHYWRIVWSSYRVGFEPTTTEFRSDALSIYVWIPNSFLHNCCLLCFQLKVRSKFTSGIFSPNHGVYPSKVPQKIYLSTTNQKKHIEVHKTTSDNIDYCFFD